MATEKKFASHADVEEKKVTFEQLSEHAYAYTAEGDPNTGIIIGDDAVLVADTQATPVMAQDVIRRIREVTDKPVKYVLLSHYHAVRVFGASAYQAMRKFALTWYVPGPRRYSYGPRPPYWQVAGGPWGPW